MNAMKIGLIGAGVISEQYLENLTKTKAVSVEMIADLDISRSEQRAQQYGITSFGTPEELLAREDIELVVNLMLDILNLYVFCTLTIYPKLYPVNSKI